MTTDHIKELIHKEMDEIPEDHLEELQRLIHHYSISIRKKFKMHPDVQKFQGLLPTSNNPRDDYYEHQLRKHS